MNRLGSKKHLSYGVPVRRLSIKKLFGQKVSIAIQLDRLGILVLFFIIKKALESNITIQLVHVLTTPSNYSHPTNGRHYHRVSITLLIIVSKQRGRFGSPVSSVARAPVEQRATK